MADLDHYSTLGLDRRCTLAQIRSAYRRLAKRHHPDVNGTADGAAQIRALNDAYAVLSDPARRRAYDRDLAAEIGAPPAAPKKIARDISHDAPLRIDELLRGAALEICVRDPGNPDGVENYALTVPPETAPGTRFRIPREGHFAGGSVIVRIRVRPDARFKARGSDLRTDLRISAQRAAHGGSETLRDPRGEMLRITIPPGIARGETLRLPGHGLPKPRGGRGELLVRITYRPEVRIRRMGS